MFDFMLDAAKQIKEVPYESVSDKLAAGGEVTLLGMGTVFSVLIIIWIMVEILHLLLGDKTKPVTKKIEPAPVVEVPSATQEEAEVSTEPAETVVATTEYDIIAVITAAVAAASGSSPNSFRVVSFKRANNKFSAGK